MIQGKIISIQEPRLRRFETAIGESADKAVDDLLPFLSPGVIITMVFQLIDGRIKVEGRWMRGEQASPHGHEPVDVVRNQDPLKKP